MKLVDGRTFALWLAAFVLLALAGCIGTTGNGATFSPGPQPSSCAHIATATPTSPPKGGCGVPLSASELRLLLLRELGPLWYCDRDSYPVGRDEAQAALDGYDEMVADAELFRAVAEDLGIDPTARHTDAEKLALYRRWKVAQAVQLEALGNDRYRFDYLAQPVAGSDQGKRSVGIVDTRGTIAFERATAEGEPICPICLSIGTLIDAPGGAIQVDRLRLGDPVWTLDSSATRVAGTVIALGSTPAPPGHAVVHLTLVDGRTVTASPGHPLADGRMLAQLRIGDAVDGSTVASLEWQPYGGRETFDLVVSGETGTYLAGGIPLGSTLD